MNYDPDEHVKEVFAHFGLAYYLSGVLETGIQNALLMLDFLTKQKAEIRRVGIKFFDRARFESEFDAFLGSQHAKTLGKLVQHLRELTNVDDSLGNSIVKAKSQRDLLAHHFFRERAEDFGSRNGRDRMLAELKGAQELFQAADRHLTTHLKPIFAELGMPMEVVDAYVQAYIQSVKSKEEVA